jgi:hypothetical protein
MKTKLLLLAIISIVTTTSFAGTVTQSIAFNDGGLGGGTANSGTYNPGDAFGFDVLLTFNGYNASAISFWLETVTAFAPFLSVTGVTYGTTFPDPSSLSPNPAPFNSGSGASPGYLAEGRDLGSGITNFNNVPGPGTYFVAHVTLQISAGAPEGTFDLESTTVPNKVSEVTSFDGTNFADRNLPAAHYLVIIGIPEPSTFTLIGLGAMTGLGLVARRSRRRRAASSV